MIHMDAEIPLPEGSYVVDRALADIDLYAVGGVVRDFLFNFYHGLAFAPKDVDFATPEEPAEILRRLHAANIKTISVGESFGVIMAIVNDEKFEIATFREDTYDPDFGDGRRPDEVKFVRTAEGDAKRRDLTINGLFYDLRRKRIDDFVGGIADIQKVIIRPIGDPRLRFQEDRLRVLRTLRFLCRYDRNKYHYDRSQSHKASLTEETKDAIREFSALEGVSGERITVEFEGGLQQAIYPPKYLALCKDFGLFPAMFGSLEIDNDFLLLANSRSPNVVLSLILKETNAKLLSSMLNDIKYQGITCRTVCFLKSLVDFDPKDVYLLAKRRDSFMDQGVLRQEVAEFSALRGISLSLIQQFMDFRPQTCAANFPNLEGPELGAAIRNGVTEEFQSKQKGI